MIARRARYCAMLAGISRLALRDAHAPERAPGSTPQHAAAKKATHPFFDTNTLQLQPAYTDMHAGGNSLQLLIRLALGYDGFLIPGLKLGDVYSVARLEMYGEALLPSGSPNVVGLQD